jgi:tetratricopeptide (TPR) repeat protein
VFISYSTQDSEIAEAARDHLERQGIPAWMAPRDIRPGEDYGSSIIAAINDAQVMVVVLSRNSDVSPAVRNEVERAFSKRVFLIPFKIEEFTLGKGLEFFLAAPQWINAAGMPRERQLALLATGVRAALSAAPGGGGVAAPEAQGSMSGTPGAAPPVARPALRATRRTALFVGSGIAAAAVIAVALHFSRDSVDIVRRAQAYESIQQGKGAEAQAYLDALQREGSSGDRAFATAGMAASQLLQGNAREASALVGKAREISRECPLCDVVEADLLLMGGKVAESRPLYRAALESRSAAPCERAAAAAGLGRGFSEEGKADEALRYYAQALEVDPGNSRALAGRARVLAATGKYDEAVAGIRGRDADPYVGQVLHTLVREMEQRRRAEQRDRISTLVDDLVKQYRERPRSGGQGDTWTSRPTALCFFETSVQGGPSYHEGEDGVFVARVQEAMLDNGRFGVVERGDLDLILQELKIASSDAADLETAVRFGRLKTAGILLYTSAVRQGGRTEIAFKAVNTETSEILGRVTATVPAIVPPEAVRDVGRQLIALLEKAYPVRGRVAAVSGSGVELNIGSGVGVKEGMVFNLLAADDAARRVGSLRIVQAAGTSSRAEVIRAAPAPRKGDRVEAAL